VVDYRKFLANEQTLALPYLGGTSVEAPGRRLRLEQPPEHHGWYSVVVKGRTATVAEAIDAPDLSRLPAVRGWVLGERLVQERALAELMLLPPADEPAPFSKAVCRRWHSGDLIFDTLDFESEVEGEVRQALAVGGSLEPVKAAPAALRAAFALALVDQVSRRIGIAASPAECRAHLWAIAKHGAPEAERVLRALEAERELARREMAQVERQRRAGLVREDLARARQGQGAVDEAPAGRAEEALARAGARLETARRLNGNQLEVVFRFMNQRFISLVDARTLQVLDSGICLGHPPRDDLITLDSLPGVIKEAIDDDVLVILRWP
jgi:hypothetical protein